MKKAIYYIDARSKEPVREFIDKLDPKAQGKILARIEFLEEKWHELRRPYVDKIPKNDILRVKKRMLDFQIRYNEGRIRLN